MGVQLAYGPRSEIDAAVSSGSIPPKTLVVTNDPEQAELFYLDGEKNLKPVAERDRFLTLTEANSWIKQYDCVGRIVSVHNGSSWVPYIVTDQSTLSPIGGGSGPVTDITTIDGGNAAGSTPVVFS